MPACSDRHRFLYPAVIALYIRYKTIRGSRSRPCNIMFLQSGQDVTRYMS